MLAKMGALLEVEADQPKSETLHDLKQLATARLALIKDRTAAKARLSTPAHSLLSRQIKRRLTQIERDLSQVTEAIDDIGAADVDLAARAEILMSLPGIAKLTACAILTDMPEPGHLSGKQAAALAGLAPLSRQSGKWRGKERIQSGRASVKACKLLTSGCCYTLQSRHEGKIRAADINREMQEAGDHSRHAKVDRYGQRTAPRSAEMGRISSLTNTDTRACKHAMPGNGQGMLACLRGQMSFKIVLAFGCTDLSIAISTFAVL